MAIKFVDKEPEDGKGKKAEAPKAKPLIPAEPAKDASDREASGDASDSEPALPGLLHAKPAPKKRGRK